MKMEQKSHSYLEVLRSTLSEPQKVRTVVILNFFSLDNEQKSKPYRTTYIFKCPFERTINYLFEIFWSAHTNVPDSTVHLTIWLVEGTEDSHSYWLKI
jgi:hypothetical protein